MCNKSEWDLYSQLTVHAILCIYFLFNNAYFFPTLSLRTEFCRDPCYCSRWWRVDRLLSLNAGLLKSSLVLLVKLLKTWFYVVWWLLISPITFNQVPTYLVVGLTRRKVRSSNFHRFFSEDSSFWLLPYRELCLSICSRWFYPGVPSLNGFS